MHRALAAVAVALALGACGGRAPIYESPPPEAGRRVTLPDPVPASPAYVAKLARPAAADRVASVEETRGVAVAAPVRVRRLAVEGPGGWHRIRVAAVDPLQFRSVAPAATREAEFVWSALVAGEAVVTFDAAQRLGVEGPTSIVVGGRRLQVSAIADMGAPGAAGIVVADFVGDELRLDAPRLIVVGARSGTVIDSLKAPLKRTLPQARLIRIGSGPARTTSAPERVGTTGTHVLAPMNFQILDNGFIRPDPAWVAANIASARVPILGTVTCHRLLLPQLARALAQVEKEGLAGEIYQYGGCYVPRFIARDPHRSLSMHAFGLALDLNVPTNALGTPGDMHPRIVEIFASWGFEWGGHWSEPDPMHFELARLVG